MQEDLVELQHDDDASDTYSEKNLCDFWCLTRNSYERIAELAIHVLLYFHQYSCVSQHFQCCWELNQNSDYNSKILNMIFFVPLLTFPFVLMCLLPKSSLNHLISLNFWDYNLDWMVLLSSDYNYSLQLHYLNNFVLFLSAFD